MYKSHIGAAILVGVAIFVVLWLSHMAKQGPRYLDSPGTPATPVTVNPWMPVTYPGPAGAYGPAGLDSAMRSPFTTTVGIGYAP